VSAPYVVVGGGAAGLCAACALALKGARVRVLEAQPRVGRKLLSTGNGRCNILNMDTNIAHWHGDAALARPVLDRWPPDRIRGFFAKLGLETVEEAEGRVYPVSRQAASVLDALRLTIPLHGGEITTDARVQSIRRPAGGNGWALTLASGETVTASKVLIAAGGQAAPKLGGCADGVKLLKSLGHRAGKCFPAIAALRTDPARVRALKGQRVHGAVSLCADGRTLRKEAGEILFGDGTLSGIAAMQCARAAQEALMEGGQPQAVLCLTDMPYEAFVGRARLLKGHLMEDVLTGLLPKRVGMEIVKAAGIDLHATAETLDERQLKKLYETVTKWRFPVTGVHGYDQAQVTAGGIRLSGFDTDTMQSRLAPGVFAAGEVLDIDGDCGGFNLRWAWASALTAAEGMLRSNGTKG